MSNAISCCHRHVMVRGAVYRTVTSQCWSATHRLADMEKIGLTHQVLSPMPELLSYWMNGTDAAVLHRDINEQMARLSNDHPAQFSCLAAVPLQNLDLAISELEYSAKVLRMAGAEIGSNINGRPIGAPEFIPFFAAAERLGMAIFVHAMRPNLDRLVGPPILEAALGFPTEVGLAAASAITSGLMLRHPELRIAFSHGGGTLATLLPRLQQAWQSTPALRESIELAPLEQARKFYYDTLVYDRELLLFLVERFGAEQLFMGTDYPFAIQEFDPLGRLTETGLDNIFLSKLRYENAERYLSLPQQLHT